MSPDQDQVKEFYDQHYYADIESAGVPTGHHRRIARRIGITAGDNVLDVACGTGEWLQAARSLGALVSGIDLSEKAIEFCQSNNPAGTFLCQGAQNLPFDDGSFDWLTCFGSLEHFPDKASSLGEMARVVKVGGQVLISVPNSDFIGYKTGLYGGTNQAAVIETPLKICEWEALAAGAGLQMEDKWRDLHFFNPDWVLQSGWLRALPRMLAASAIAALPLNMQYQVYFHYTKPF
jgi:SAM-dependent methyltransferase